MNFQYSFTWSRHWPLAVSLLGLLATGPAAYAQTTLYNPPGKTFNQAGSLYNVGTVQNAGSYAPTSGTLLIAGGDFINTGSISTGATTGTVKLLESVASTGHSLSLGGNAVPNLELDVPANTTMGSSGTVTGTLTMLNGHLLTSPTSASNYVLTLGSAATIVGETAAHYIKGRVTQARSLSGSSPIDFGNMGFTLNPAGSSFSLTVERRAGLNRAGVSYGENPAMPTQQGIDRIWALNSTTTTLATPVTITLSWLSTDDHGLTFTGTNAQVWRSDDGGTIWVKQGAIQNGASRSVSVAITQLNSIYTVSTSAAPLPVELISFTGVAVGNNALLKWRTASEKNSAYFEVQQSTNGSTNWRTLGRLPAAGNSSSPNSYDYTDANINRYGVPVIYYRLRQLDLDDQTAFSQVIALRPTVAVDFALEVWPNPTADNAQLRVISPSSDMVSVTVYDITGHQLYEQVAIPNINLPLPSAIWAAGTYLVRVRQGTHISTQTLIRK